MMRVNFLLLLAVMGSALFLVHVQYDSRRLFTELDKSAAEGRQLSIEYERLQVDKRAQATPARVEKIAREKLQMRQVGPAITQYVNYSAPAAAATPPSSAAAARAQRAEPKPFVGGNP